MPACSQYTVFSQSHALFSLICTFALTLSFLTHMRFVTHMRSLHPDKNSDFHELAKIAFADLVSAYEVGGSAVEL